MKIHTIKEEIEIDPARIKLTAAKLVRSSNGGWRLVGRIVDEIIIDEHRSVAFNASFRAPGQQYGRKPSAKVTKTKKGRKQ